MRAYTRKAGLSCGVAAIAIICASTALAQAKSFDVPSEDAVNSIPEFARQAGVQIVAPADQLKGRKTDAIKGNFEVRTGLAKLLQGTGLQVARTDDQTIILTASRKNVSAAPLTEGAAPSPMMAASPNVTVAQNDQLATEEITVTGTLLARGVSVTPVTTVSADELNVTGPVNIADALNALPQLQSQNGGSPNRSQPSFTGFNSLNLRNLGVNRTLVLLDGQRFVPVGVSYNASPPAVNIDSLPQGLVKRVDIVTGGASASYGSDAVAGVVNFVLDNEFTGIKLDSLIGETQYGDDQEYKIELTAGGAFDGGKGHVVIDASLSHTTGSAYDPTGTNGSRPWNKTESSIIATGGTPAYAVIPNTRVELAPFGGVVVGGPFNGTGFKPDGSTYAYNFGTNTFGQSAPFQATGGDGFNQLPVLQLSSPRSLANFYARGSYQITPSIEVYATATFAQGDSVGGITVAPNIAYGPYTIAVDNAYLPANLRSAMIAQGVKSLSVAEANEYLSIGFNNTLMRGILGADGTFDLGSTWNWRTYFEVGQVNTQTAAYNDPNLQNIFLATDAVVSPAGTIVCRSTLTYPSNGCVPLNVIGQHTPTAAQQAYSYGTARTDGQSREEAFEFQVNGAPITEWAGDVNVAVGGGYRLESLLSSSDSVSAGISPYNGSPGGWGFFNSTPIYGSYHLWEGFAEVAAPLVKDASFTKSLDINMAARYTGYSSSGDISTWKVGVNWVPIDDVRIVAAQSRDVRAPNANDLFSPRSTVFQSGVVDFKTGQTVGFTAISQGNPNLGPEKSITDTLGVTYAPSWLPGFSTKIEEWNIKIQGTIGGPSAQFIVNQCAAGNAIFCAQITRDANGNISSINKQAQNLGSYVESGTDFEFDYTTPLDLWGSEGNFAARLLGTHYDRAVSIARAGAAPQEGAGVVGINQNGIPHMTIHGDASYNVGNWGLDVQEQYVSGGWIQGDETNAGIQEVLGNQDRLGAQWYTNLTLQYTMGNVQLYGSVVDLFNADPPTGPEFGFGQSNTASSYYYTQGRAFTLGVRIRN